MTDLSVAIGGRRLLHGFSLALCPGEQVALVGPSGCGKTLLLRTIALLRDPERGSLKLGGKAPAELGYPAYRRRVAYVAQRPVLFSGSVEDNLRRPFRYASVAAEYPAAEVGAFLERLGIDDSELPAEARDLSEGQKQRVALVRALATSPEVLLLDEPTSGLDAASAKAVERLLAERVREGRCAVLWVTHDRDQAERACDRIIDLEAHLG
jgi:putative ABC transport system ATP-binding protein